MNKDLSTKFCAHPWEFLEIQEKGLYNCCPRWVNHNKIGELNPTVDFMQEWNSKKSKEFRQSILDGTFSKCNHEECPMIQNGCLPERKDIMDGKYGDELKFILEFGMDVAQPPNTINLCYDKSCNLRCPSCRKNLIQYGEKNEPEKYKNTMMINKRLLRMVHSKPHKVHLNITGSGDPFGSPSYFELMKKIEPAKNPYVSITLQTNGVLFDEQRWEKLKNIHKLDINAIISLDAGIQEHYDKVRVGGDWNKLMKNLHFISKLVEKGQLKSVRLDMVVQKNNYKSIPEFIQIAQAHNFDSYTSRIFNWGTFTSQEYNVHNIFDKRHPEHKAFLEILNQDYHYHKHDWGNLTDFITD